IGLRDVEPAKGRSRRGDGAELRQDCGGGDAEAKATAETMLHRSLLWLSSTSIEEHRTLSLSAPRGGEGFDLMIGKFVCVPQVSPEELSGLGHAGADVAPAPAGEVGQGLGLARETLRQRGAILAPGFAGGGAGEGMAQHVAALEILAVAGLEERQ